MTTTITRLADLQAAHADLRARYHAIDAEIADLMDANTRGEVPEDAAWYAAVDSLVAEQNEVAAAEEAMRPEIHQLTREQVEVDDDAEVIRVRGINVACFERGLDSDVTVWACDEYPENTCRSGKSWIEGPRGLIAAMVGACSEMADTNITETAGWDWPETTPEWMREQAIERMIAGAERACTKIDAQL